MGGNSAAWVGFMPRSLNPVRPRPPIPIEPGSSGGKVPASRVSLAVSAPAKSYRFECSRSEW